MTWEVLGRIGDMLLPYSEDFSEWVNQNTTIVEAEKETSFGNVLVTTLTDSGTSTFGNVLTAGSSTINRASTEKRCFSLFVEKDFIPASTRYGMLRISFDTASSYVDLRFDTSTGETYLDNNGVLLVDFDGGAIDEDDFFRFWVSASATGLFYRVNIFPASGKTTLATTISASVTGSISCFGAQLEFSDYPSNYRKTEGVSAWVTQSDVSTTWVNQ